MSLWHVIWDKLVDNMRILKENYRSLGLLMRAILRSWSIYLFRRCFWAIWTVLPRCYRGFARKHEVFQSRDYFEVITQCQTSFGKACMDE